MPLLLQTLPQFCLSLCKRSPPLNDKTDFVILISIKIFVINTGTEISSGISSSRSSLIRVVQIYVTNLSSIVMCDCMRSRFVGTLVDVIIPVRERI